MTGKMFTLNMIFTRKPGKNPIYIIHAETLAAHLAVNSIFKALKQRGLILQIILEKNFGATRAKEESFST